MSKSYLDERCVFDEEVNPDELYDLIVEEIQNNYDEPINWRKAKSVLNYIKDAIDEGEDQEYITETAMHQLEEMDI